MKIYYMLIPCLAFSHTATAYVPGSNAKSAFGMVQFWTEKRGEVMGQGKTKADAYADAVTHIPDGAASGKADYVGSDDSVWVCYLTWTKN